MSFSGESYNSIDAKGRVVIPIKLREQLKDGFVITNGLDQCAFILPRKDYDNIESKLTAMSITNGKARKMQRFFLGSKIDGEFDSQGRVSLSQRLRDYAGLQKEVVVAGVGSRIEIWDKKSYEEHIKAFSEDPEFMEGIEEIEL